MIRIIKDETGLKFYWKEDGQPSAVIYEGSDVGIVNDVIVATTDDARSLAELLQVMAVVMHGIQNQKSRINIFNAEYRNKVMEFNQIVPYSAKQVFQNIYTGAIVSGKKGEAVKRQLESFGYEDSTLIINYKPVLW